MSTSFDFDAIDVPRFCDLNALDLNDTIGDRWFELQEQEMSGIFKTTLQAPELRQDKPSIVQVTHSKSTKTKAMIHSMNSLVDKISRTENFVIFEVADPVEKSEVVNDKEVNEKKPALMDKKNSFPTNKKKAVATDEKKSTMNNEKKTVSIAKKISVSATEKPPVSKSIENIQNVRQALEKHHNKSLMPSNENASGKGPIRCPFIAGVPLKIIRKPTIPSPFKSATEERHRSRSRVRGSPAKGMGTPGDRKNPLILSDMLRVYPAPTGTPARKPLTVPHPFHFQYSKQRQVATPVPPSSTKLSTMKIRSSSLARGCSATSKTLTFAHKPSTIPEPFRFHETKRRDSTVQKEKSDEKLSEERRSRPRQKVIRMKPPLMPIAPADCRLNMNKVPKGSTSGLPTKPKIVHKSRSHSRQNMLLENCNQQMPRSKSPHSPKLLTKRRSHIRIIFRNSNKENPNN